MWGGQNKAIISAPSKKSVITRDENILTLNPQLTSIGFRLTGGAIKNACIAPSIGVQNGTDLKPNVAPYRAFRVSHLHASPLRQLHVIVAPAHLREGLAFYPALQQRSAPGHHVYVLE